MSESPGRRDVLRGVAAAGAFLAVDAAALLTAFNRIGPKRLTPQAFLDAFNNAFGRHHGYRTNHAKGVSVGGWFESNGNASELSTAAVFAPGRTPVIGRFSAAGGNPHTADSAAAGRGLGLAFGFPGARQWRTAMLNLPVFPDPSPQSMYDRLVATATVPGTGKPDPNAMTRFYADHPPAARAMSILKQHKPTPGFADSTFSGLVTFYVVNASGARTPVRWSLTPLQQALPPASGPDALFDPLARQLRAGPLRWRLILTVGTPDDPTDDATIPWPVGRRTVDAGLLTLDSVQADATGNARDINFDPLVLPPGIEPSDDPLLSARSAVYAASYRRRTGEDTL
ncbi:catalase family peroxidase [Candidatus Mycobacterium wuenschmannii]|uniref:Catalase-related peroxidase n=1 Tax=Candidatus Mycobacterium wuenschmannii TaxID=3027808 RepID=A0ABY8W0A6_9MYCO|nr:catalase family peroxidase [Candidatus Mycobacterium wuenschmannii]WIM89293.1 catalase family peroxidase [Candidatus Mycobacterium wuenschmannii]